jgi:uncharacterized protein YxeA
MRKKLVGIVIVMLMITIGFTTAEKHPTNSTTTNTAEETTLQTEIMTRDFDVSYQLFQSIR